LKAAGKAGLSHSTMNIGAKILRVKSCPSTNDLAKELALSGESEGMVVIAEEQTKGKGTKGRSWYSARKKGLYLSVVLTPPFPDISLLPLVAGLAVSDAILSCSGIRVGLKWPNDLVWGGKKLGGILCESGFLGNRVNYAILGVGLNVTHDKGDFPKGIRSQAISLKLIKKERIEEDAFLGCLWQFLNHWYGCFLKGEKQKILRAYQEKSVLALGQKIDLITDGEVLSGVYRGLDPQGGLILERDGRRESFFSAEIKRIQKAKKEE
jgi:BirA family biotin operon repressor/biotin-[acetyl-CoA-carboxylase] ligase